ncbi:MAG: pantetheine-phosphate adenylyltransferase [Verrucomicrobiota bacterium]
MRIAVYPGTFDPITKGHLDVLERAQRLFDKVVIAVAANTGKTPLFSVEERVELATEAVKCLEVPTEVKCFNGLLVDFVQNQGACAIVRGLRAISDFEFEFQMALMNRKLRKDVETIFLMPRESYTYLSSSIIREVAKLGGDFSNFVSPNVEQALKAKLKTL